MGLWDLFRRAPAASAAPAMPQAQAAQWYPLLDDALATVLSEGRESGSGQLVSAHTALLNSAVFRSVSLISSAIGMLPLHLINQETKAKATEHPLFKLLHQEPNSWQTSFDFRKLMQRRALVKGNGYARIIWSRGKAMALIPIDPDAITPVQNPDWTVSYKFNRTAGGSIMLAPEEVFHLRGESEDGINGISLVFQAREAIGLALSADKAIARVFRNGSFIDGTLQTDMALSDEARANIRDSWAARYGGAENAGKTPLLDHGLKYVVTGSTAKDAQTNETRARQIEEVARIFGVPRPLLMVDDTSWGSGIDSLGQLFVQYSLNPWFEAWQQAIGRSLLLGADKDNYTVKFNASALERGNMEAQGSFFAQALGAGGAQAWMTPNEIRDVLDLPAHPDGDKLTNPMTAPAVSAVEKSSDAPASA